jgi:hypothetical protein
MHPENTGETLVTDLYSICNILLYFCNIHLKHLQHTSKTYKTLETYACNIRFEQNMAVRRAEHSDCAVMVEKKDGCRQAPVRPSVIERT